jgi:hypothetical protein
LASKSLSTFYKLRQTLDSSQWGPDGGKDIAHIVPIANLDYESTQSASTLGVPNKGYKIMNSQPQSRIVEAVLLLLVSVSVVLATIDPSTRPRFIDLTKSVVQAYIGRLYLPAPKKREQR